MADIIDIAAHRAPELPESWRCGCGSESMRLEWTGRAFCAECGNRQDIMWIYLMIADDDISRLMRERGIGFVEAVELLAETANLGRH